MYKGNFQKNVFSAFSNFLDEKHLWHQIKGIGSIPEIQTLLFGISFVYYLANFLYLKEITGKIQVIQERNKIIKK